MPLKRKPSGIYYADIVTASGQRIRPSSRTRDEAAAKEWYAKLVDEHWRQKALREKPRRTWNEAAEAYMEEKEGTPSYDQNITRIARLDPYLGGLYLVDIDKELLNVIKRDLLKDMKASTANRYRAFIMAVLNYAADELEWIERVPKVKPAEEEPPRIEFLTPAEVDALIAHLASKKRSKHLVKFVAFAVATGLRMSNITKLEWSQIDMERRCMWIEAPDAKGRRPIPVPLTDDAYAVVRSQMGQHLTRVFTYRGKPYDRVKPDTLKRAAKAAGIHKKVTAHLFRHTFASWHIMSGTSLVELKDLGGWAKLESVLIYAHLSAEHLRRAAENRAQIRHTLENLVDLGTAQET